MKPKIDLESPITKIVLSLLDREVKIAWEMEQSVEKAVLPIYYIPKRKAHQKKKTKPEQFGTGVLVRVKDEYFIFSATHVFIEFEGNGVLIGKGQNKPIEQLAGERFSTGNIETKKVDSNDATVFHIQSKMSQELKNLAITLDDCDFDGFDNLSPIYMITGFLAKESNTAGNQIKTKCKNFPTVEITDYNEYGYDKERHIVLSYTDQVLVQNKWQKTPVPRGMSGGAIIKADGTSVKVKKQRQLLTAITTEQHKDKGEKLGYVLGTRINVHFGLINKFLPELLEDFLAEYNTEPEK
jgi:hypothetical protein